MEPSRKRLASLRSEVLLMDKSRAADAACEYDSRVQSKEVRTRQVARLESTAPNRSSQLRVRLLPVLHRERLTTMQACVPLRETNIR